MDFLTLLSSLAIVGVVLWAVLRQRRGRKKKAEKVDHRTRRERAVWAWAMVVKADAGPVDAGGRARVNLELEVHMPGTPVYTALVSWLVEQEGLAYVETGKEISVRADPQGPEFIYPDGSWARFVE
ncbi:MAG: hypothetical protein JXB85_10465 [Anaerolineales bacterium]|nr:hypothetical protein [Anaerolineales bacterium]